MPSTAVGPDRNIRRGVALLLSLAMPGLGNVSLGYPKRAVVWLSCHIVLVLAMTTGIHFGWALTLPLAVPGLLLVRMASALFTLRLPRSAQLPRGLADLAISIGLLIAWQLSANQFRTHVLEAFQIPSGAMYPTLEAGDHVFAEKLDRSFGLGDVVVFGFPRDPSVTYVKRLVARGGDRVELRDGVLIVNDSPVPTARTAESCFGAPEAVQCSIWEEELGGHRYRVARTRSESDGSFGPVVVPRGQVYVLGDNRDNSHDSRAWGGVKEELLIAKLKAVWWSRGPDGIRWNRLNLQVE